MKAPGYIAGAASVFTNCQLCNVATVSGSELTEPIALMAKNCQAPFHWANLPLPRLAVSPASRGHYPPSKLLSEGKGAHQLNSRNLVIPKNSSTHVAAAERFPRAQASVCSNLPQIAKAFRFVIPLAVTVILILATIAAVKSTTGKAGSGNPGFPPAPLDPNLTSSPGPGTAGQPRELLEDASSESNSSSGSSIVSAGGSSSPGQILPPGPSYGSCISITSIEISVSTSGTSASLAWSFSAATSSISFSYGTQSNNLTPVAAGQSGVTLTPLSPTNAGTVYYYLLQGYTSACATPHNEAQRGGSFIAFGNPGGGGSWTGSGGGQCPISSLLVTSFTEYGASGGRVWLRWTVGTTPSLTLPATQTTLYLIPIGSGNSYTELNPTSPYHTPALSNINYYATLWIQSPCYSDAWSTITFAGGCVSTALDGYISIAQSSTPIFKASATITSYSGPNPIPTTLTNFSDVSGRFSFAWACSVSGTYSGTLDLAALGFSATSATFSISAHRTTWVNLSLEIRNVDDDGLFNTPTGQDRIYNLSSSSTLTTGWTLSGLTQVLSWQSGSASATFVSPSSAGISSPPSGDSTIVEYSAADGSSPSSTGANSYFSVGAIPTPNDGDPSGTPVAFSSPMALVYYVYVQNSPNTNSGFGVDAQLSDGGFLSVESTGYSTGPLDSTGHDCSAGSLPTTLDAWVQVECDLSPYHDLTISKLLLDYVDYGHVNSPATYTAYFDSIRLIKSPEPRAVVNGNFEDSTLYGWILSHSPKPTVATTTSEAGNQSIQMTLSPTVCSHDGGCYYTETASQDFRIPNYLDSTSNPRARTLNLTGYLDYGVTCTNPNCPVSSNATIGFVDQTAPDKVLGTIVSSSTAGWTAFTAINVTSIEGHIVSLVLSVHAEATNGDGVGTVTGYFDNLQLIPFGTFLQENGSTGSQAYTGQMLLPFKVYNPSCGGGGYGGDYTWTFDAPYENQAWDIQQVPWENSQGEYGYLYTSVTSNLTLSVDLRSLTHACAFSADSLMLGLSTMANATGVLQRPNGSIPSSGDWDRTEIMNVCLGVQEVMESGDAISYAPSAVGPQNTLNLGSSSPGVGPASVEDSYTAEDFAVSAIEGVAVLLLEAGLGIATLDLDVVFEAVLGMALDAAVGLLGNLYAASLGGGGSSICTLSGSNVWGETLNAAPYATATQFTVGANLFAGCMNSQGQNSCSANPSGGTYLIKVVAQANLGCVGGCIGVNGPYYATETATLNLRLQI